MTTKSEREIALEREVKAMRKLVALQNETAYNQMLIIISQSCEIVGHDVEEIVPGIAKKIEEAGLA